MELDLQFCGSLFGNALDSCGFMECEIFPKISNSCLDSNPICSGRFAGLELLPFFF